jgi:hypothetical protein
MVENLVGSKAQMLVELRVGLKGGLMVVQMAAWRADKMAVM